MLLFFQISFLFKIYDNVFARCQVSCLNTNYHFCRFKLNWRSKTSSKYFNGKIAKSRQSCDLTLHVLVFCSASVKKLNCISNRIDYNITYIILKHIGNSNALYSLYLDCRHIFCLVVKLLLRSSVFILSVQIHCAEKLHHKEICQ